LALYQASVLAVNKCEYDHPDYFPTEEAYFACFEKAKRQAGAVVDSENLPPIAELDDVLVDLPPHNRRNARAAVEVALRRGHALADIIRELPDVVSRLPDRRFQKVWPREKDAPIAVYTDYAHHPTEIKATLKAAQNLKHNRIWCLFQPHTYTRVMALFDQFADAFEDADVVVLAEIYAAREKNIYKLSSKKLMEEIKVRHPGKEVYFLPDFDSICDFVYNNASEGDVVMTMGAGDIYKIGDMLLGKDK